MSKLNLIKLIPPTKIYSKKSQFAGRGVFASSEIKAGEIIEVAPIIVLEFAELIDTKWNNLFNYYFWMDDFVVLALGHGSLYNHSPKANAKYLIDKKNKTITFTALEDIALNQEIFFNYKGSSKTEAPLWFEKR